jgi:phosphoribosylaminoimidazole-succinocarboxamide synthase
VATDRLSAFDRVLTTVPGKGQILTHMASYWFERTRHIVPNHVVAVPDPCVMVGREVSIIPIEVIVRGFLAGSAWRDYQSGKLTSGVSFPPGMREFEQLREPVVTPSTKEALGKHDQPISESEIVRQGLAPAKVWDEVRSKALELFSLASREVSARGLLFVDTKYEFGLLDGSVILADEIHTLDSSRFWLTDSYERTIISGDAPEMLDKEPIRRWLLARGFSGEGEAPYIADDYRNELTQHYVRSCERITGRPCELNMEEPNARIDRSLRSYFGVSTPA